MGNRVIDFSQNLQSKVQLTAIFAFDIRKADTYIILNASIHGILP